MSETDLFPCTLDEMIAELEREIALREVVYPRWVAEKKMRQHKADECMRRIRAALRTLQSLRDNPK